jgi:hypothetical protein
MTAPFGLPVHPENKGRDPPNSIPIKYFKPRKSLSSAGSFNIRVHSHPREAGNKSIPPPSHVPLAAIPRREAGRKISLIKRRRKT